MNLYTEFILCYRDHHALNWNCEKGYKTISEADDRTTKVLEANNQRTTMIIPVHSVPEPIKQIYLKSILTPDINLNDKPSVYKPKGAYY